MGIEKFVELYKTIMEKYSWKAMYENAMNDDRPHVRSVKYVRFSIDTRDGEIWCATFQKSTTEDITFRLDDDEEIKSMFKWLDGADEIL